MHSCDPFWEVPNESQRALFEKETALFMTFLAPLFVFHWYSFRIYMILIRAINKITIMNYKELKALLKDRHEGLNLEFKREISDHYKFAKTAASMANSSGFSRIFIGVIEENKLKPIVFGVNYDEQTHSKDRIMNILSDRIEPKITSLSVDLVSLKGSKKGKYVFVVSIPPSQTVHGVKDVGGWRYYIRRSGKVDEMIPPELQQLCKLKNSYADNMNTRSALLETSRFVKREFARYLGLDEDQFSLLLKNEKEFRDYLPKVPMRNLTKNFVDLFYDLKVNITYAMTTIPHGDLNVEEMRFLRDIEKEIEESAPEVEKSSGAAGYSFDSAPIYESLSLMPWIKFSMELLEPNTREPTWDKLRFAFHSYDMNFGDFLKHARKLGLPFDRTYEEDFERGLFLAIKNICKKLSDLELYLEDMQTKYGKFIKE